MPELAIVINLHVEGIHCWPECDIPQVEYLKNPHRHVFFIRLKKKVYQENRDIEIIQFKQEVKTYIKRKYYSPDLECCDFKNLSCESIASELFKEFRLVSCEVLEDGENGAEVSI